jgi:hypothetical protein
VVDDVLGPEVLDPLRVGPELLNVPPIPGQPSGAFTEILLDRGLGTAAVAIDAAAARVITKLPFSTLKSAFQLLKSLANRHGAVGADGRAVPLRVYQHDGGGRVRCAYERYAVPGPGRVLWQGALANFNRHTPDRVHFRNDDRAPLLLIGGADHVVPAAVDRQTGSQAGQVQGGHRVQGVSRPLGLHDRPARLGRNRRLPP